jgi:hypothetical protein
MRDWIPFLSTLAGGLLTFLGGWTAQWLTKRREFALDERRAARARADTAAERSRQLILDVAQYTQAYESLVARMEDQWSSAPVPRPDELMHRDLLTARVRTGNHPLLLTAWTALTRTEDCIDSYWTLGNFRNDGDGGHTWIDESEFFMIGAHVAVEAVVFAATAELGPEQDRAVFAGPAIALAAAVHQAFDDDSDGRSAAAAMQAALAVAREISASRQQRVRSATQITTMISEHARQPDTPPK